MKTKNLLLGLTALFIFFAKSAKAVCPVCVVAISSGVGLCRWFGVDDAISGLWIGALILAMIIWTLNWMNKRNIHFNFRNPVVFLFFYLIVIWPLYLAGIMGHPSNTVFGIDKILFGIIVGSFILTLGVFANGALKKKNSGKVYFPYQKVVIPVAFLLIASLIFHFIIGCKIKLPF